MQVAHILDTPSGQLLRGLFTVRENPFLLFMSRRDARNRRIPALAVAYLLVMGLVVAGGLALGAYVPAAASYLFPRNPSAGTLASAMLTTAEFWMVVAWARRSRFAASSALERQALADYTLMPLTPSYRAGLQRTYPAFLATALCIAAVPFHVVASMGGGGGLWDLAATQIFIVVCAVGWVDDPAQVAAAEKSKDIPTPQKVRARQRALWINLFINGPNLAFQLSRTRFGTSATGWVLFFPYMLPAWLLAPRLLWWWPAPAALLLLAALPFSIACSERLAARAIQGRPETIRVLPWSFGLTGTLVGLTLVLGFLWPTIRTGWPARILASPGPDPLLAGEGVLAALLVLWATRSAARFARPESTLTYGPLPAPNDFVDPLDSRRAWRFEVGWLLEAVGSLYVPVGAVLLAWLIGGDMPWPRPVECLPMLAAAASIVAALWAIGRFGVWCSLTGRMRLYRWTTAGFTIASIVGVLMPPPYGRYVLALSPYASSLGLIPWVREWFSSRFPLPAGDFPVPGLIIPLQLALAAAGTWLGIRTWAVRRAALPEIERPEERAVGSVAPHYERIALVERLTQNPIGIRLFRARNAVAPEGVLGLSLGGAVLAYLVWAVCVGWGMVAPRPSIAADYIARQPWVLALPVIFAVAVSILAATMQAGLSVRVERLLGAFGLTCLTPLSDREMLDGYLVKPRLTMRLALSGAVLSLPLLWVNTPAVPVTIAVIAVALIAIPFGASVLRLQLSEALPAPSVGFARSALDTAVLVAAGVLLALQGIALVVCPIVILAVPHGRGHESWVLGATLGVAGCCVLNVLIAVWSDHRLRRRFEDVRRLAIPQGPDEAMGNYLAAQGVRLR
jgi:hypothetical protein